MDLIDDFFSYAVRLAAPEKPSDTEQIDFRRAVSAAYYAVFHLLTMTAAESWAVGRERHRLLEVGICFTQVAPTDCGFDAPMAPG